jgi:hypothetical protein
MKRSVVTCHIHASHCKWLTLVRRVRGASCLNWVRVTGFSNFNFFVLPRPYSELMLGYLITSSKRHGLHYYWCLSSSCYAASINRLLNIQAYCLLFIHQWLYIPLLGPGLFFSFVIFFTQSVGLLRQGISPSEGRCLHTGQHKQNVIKTYFLESHPTFFYTTCVGLLLPSDT